jgi:hypothetical protein
MKTETEQIQTNIEKYRFHKTAMYQRGQVNSNAYHEVIALMKAKKHAEAQKKYRLAHPKKVAEYNREYYYRTHDHEHIAKVHFDEHGSALLFCNRCNRLLSKVADF